MMGRTWSDRAPLVAIVEADRALGELLRDAFREEGYDAALCPHRSAATATIHVTNPDLVLINSWLGRRDDGWKLVAELRGQVATERLPVIVFSSDLENPATLRDRCRQSRLCAIVAPFDLENLLARAAECLAACERAAGARQLAAAPGGARS